MLPRVFGLSALRIKKKNDTLTGQHFKLPKTTLSFIRLALSIRPRRLPVTRWLVEKCTLHLKESSIHTRTQTSEKKHRRPGNSKAYRSINMRQRNKSNHACKPNSHPSRFSIAIQPAFCVCVCVCVWVVHTRHPLLLSDPLPRRTTPCASVVSPRVSCAWFNVKHITNNPCVPCFPCTFFGSECKGVWRCCWKGNEKKESLRLLPPAPGHRVDGTVQCWKRWCMQGRAGVCWWNINANKHSIRTGATVSGRWKIFRRWILHYNKLRFARKNRHMVQVRVVRREGAGICSVTVWLCLHNVSFHFLAFNPIPAIDVCRSQFDVLIACHSLLHML